MRADSSTAIHFLLASRQCELNNLHYLLKSGELVGKISQLVHMLQCERGASNLYLCSTGNRFADELTRRVNAVDIAQRPVMDALIQLEKTAAALPQSSRLFSRMASTVYALSVLSPLRRKIHERSLPQPGMTAFFNDIIRHLLALVSELTDTAAEPTITRALIAMLSFMQGKEFAGQERALGSAAFAAGYFDDGMRRQMVELIDSQERCFERFLDFTDEMSRRRWSDQAADSEFERFRRIACTRTVASISAQEEGQRWFTLASRRLDGMKQVEEGLEQLLLARCQECIDAAELAGNDQQADIETFMSRQDEQPPDYAVFVTGNGSCLPANGWLHGDGLPPQLGRSLLVLIQQQDRRLQSMDQELAVLRVTLNERRQIERAKGLLMQHRGLSEQEAYTTLRGMAMSQNKKLIDIATAMLTIADILPSHP
ncbi:nitrate- and nitrite sensing domain-containing protein [Acerihabitans sp. TG2]|uniref:nitrate- and nitrite sensing domain-containing protein n=1 Tax=Acerihabitans sp. TG2 TaxID=3096008 RepID=UPI002B22E694|nr:nitrate- and nitrite sensing domain-containing protein [Acerihabitans sp. TG2]MEA9390174.1 nitrate- and nitrite sensing domain-containing protein [Acerihabitans sp. TG2]